jgi:hypothetical protein
MEICCNAEKWTYLAQEGVQWKVLVLLVLKSWILLQGSWLIKPVDQKMGCKDGKWMELAKCCIQRQGFPLLLLLRGAKSFLRS